MDNNVTLDQLPCACEKAIDLAVFYNVDKETAKDRAPVCKLAKEGVCTGKATIINQEEGKDPVPHCAFCKECITE